MACDLGSAGKSGLADMLQFLLPRHLYAALSWTVKTGPHASGSHAPKQVTMLSPLWNY